VTASPEFGTFAAIGAVLRAAVEAGTTDEQAHPLANDLVRCCGCGSLRLFRGLSLHRCGGCQRPGSAPAASPNSTSTYVKLLLHRCDVPTPTDRAVG
jgi:hypothetical protein